jgi:hypothetical protein
MRNAGERRTEVDYVWPALLVRPTRDVRIVYLDLNHWIGLAKASVGHPDGLRHVAALEAAREAKASGTAIFPLSSAHYMEISRMRDYRHRRDIARVMEELSDFQTLAARSVIMRLVIETALDRVARRPIAYAPVKLIGQGSGPAFGKVGGLRIRAIGRRDITDDVRREWRDGPEAFDAMMRDLNIRLERAVLEGPSPQVRKRVFELTVGILRLLRGSPPTAPRPSSSRRRISSSSSSSTSTTRRFGTSGPV